MHKAWQAWTFVDFGQASSGQDGRAGVGFSAIRVGGFLPVEAAGGYKTMAGAYFRGRGACTQYDHKVIMGAKPLDPKCGAYYGS